MMVRFFGKCAFLSVPAQARRRDPDRHRVHLREAGRGELHTRDVLGILLDIRRNLIERRRLMIDDRRAREYHHISAPAVAIKVERHCRVLLDIAQLRHVLLAVDQQRPGILEKPDQARLGRQVGAHGRQLDHALLAQPPRNPRAKLGVQIKIHLLMLL